MTAHLSANATLRTPSIAKPGLPTVLPILTLMLSLTSLFATGCESKFIGRPCDVQKPDAGSNQAVYNAQALECPSNICLRQSSALGPVDTTATCTAECSNDKDCEGGETRKGKNPNDKRCIKGFACAIEFEVGPLCCRKLCLCKDFLADPPQGGYPVPAACVPNTGSTCANVK